LCQKLWKFVELCQVIPKILLVPFFSGHGVYFTPWQQPLKMLCCQNSTVIIYFHIVNASKSAFLNISLVSGARKQFVQKTSTGRQALVSCAGNQLM